MTTLGHVPVDRVRHLLDTREHPLPEQILRLTWLARRGALEGGEQIAV